MWGINHDSEVQGSGERESGRKKLSCAFSQALEVGHPEHWRGGDTPHGTGTSSGRAGGVLGVLRSNSPEKPGGEGTGLLWGSGQSNSEYRWGLYANGKGAPSFLRDPQPCLERVSCHGPTPSAEFLACVLWGV